MKVFISTLLICFFAFSSCSIAQSKDKKETTIILVRHAEKDTVGNNPSLSEAGVQRALKLQTVFPGVVPDAFYSTNYKRTLQTVEPWSKNAGKEIILYQPSKQDSLADELKKMTGKTIVVTGHSNTIPSLVNLLLEDEKFANLPDSEYSTIFVVTIKRGIAKVKKLTF